MVKPPWFEFRITLGNVVSMLAAVLGLAVTYTALTIKVDTIASAVTDIPAIERRLQTVEEIAEDAKAVSVLERRVTAVEFSSTTSSNAVKTLADEVSDQGRVQTLMLQSLARIEERLSIPR